MHRDAHIFRDWLDTLLIEWGIPERTALMLDGWIVLLLIVILALLGNAFMRWGVVRSVRWIIHHTKAKWDNFIFCDSVISRLCGIVTPVVLTIMLPLLFASFDNDLPWLLSLLTKIVDTYMILACVRFVNSLLRATFDYVEHRPGWHNRPIKGLLQTGQVLLACVTVILIIAVFIDKSPAILLTGIGASAAVLMVVFKDSILGLVAGVQLSVNNMLKVGDWITMTHRGIDGVVEEVALTTIKVRAWDNTVQTLPPYLLISEPFDNWQAMRDRGGRRIKRSLNIDMTSVTFLSEAKIEELRNDPMTRDSVAHIVTTTEEGRTLTNLDLFMRVLIRHIDHHPRINHTMTVMVRQLQPTEWGLPIELYCFTADVNWVPYEQLQGEIISYVVALAPYFGLRMYQAPSSHDLCALHAPHHSGITLK